MYSKFLTPLAVVSLFLGSCFKTTHVPDAPTPDKLVTEARQYFNDSILSVPGLPADYKSGIGREVLWDKAYTLNLQGGRGVLAPVRYVDPLFIRSEFSGNRLFSLNNLTRLLVYRSAEGQLHAEVVTWLPDSNYLEDPAGAFTGYLDVDDWWGNSLDRYLYERGSVKKYVSPVTQASTVIRSCNITTGYNYAQGDPGGGYAWSQAGGCYYMYLPDRADQRGGLGGGLGSGGAGGGGLGSGALSISVAPPDNPIANVLDYMKCFTNVGGSDHMYTVTICVEQPIPNTREPWKAVDGGPIGSSNAGNVVDVGHTFLVFTETYGGTTITRNVGFYPSRGVTPRTPSAPGKLNNDENHAYNISASFSVTSANFFIMLNSITRGSDPSFSYNLSSENCTTFCLQTLGFGGISLPSTIGSWPGGMGCNPGDLGEDLRQMTLLPNMTKGTVQNFHPNVGNCQ